jgi:hypothetical protein
MPEGARALEEQLGGPPPPGLVGTIGDADLGALARDIATTRRGQRQQLTEAGEAGLRHVPALLRTPVKRIVGLR